MVEPKARDIDGLKFMWDGKEYGDADEAEEAKSKYEKENFVVRIVEEDGQIRVYTRRVVTEVSVEGSPTG